MVPALRARCCAERWPGYPPCPGGGVDSRRRQLLRRPTRPCRRVHRHRVRQHSAARALWRLLDDGARTTIAIDMRAAQVAVAAYCPDWWSAVIPLPIRRLHVTVWSPAVFGPRLRARETNTSVERQDALSLVVVGSGLIDRTLPVPGGVSELGGCGASVGGRDRVWTRGVCLPGTSASRLVARSSR